MKKLLFSLAFLVNLVCTAQQSSIRVYLEKPNQFYKQTVIAFTDNTTSGFDVCCDAYRLPGNPNGIWTYIEDTQYSINAFGPLVDDTIVNLGTSASPDTGLFIIGIDNIVGDTLPVVLIDDLIPGYHVLPYVCEGPIADRFALIFEKPMKVIVNSGCEEGYVVIDNDEPNTPYHLINESTNETLYLPSYTDTVYGLSSGPYTLCLYDSIYEQTSFTVDNTVIDASLYIPYTTLYIGDSYVAPVLSIYSLYDSIEWDFGDGTIMTNDINPVHAYGQVGTYTLTVTITEGSCSKVFQSEITVMDVMSVNYINLPKYRPSKFYYAIDGKLVKKL